MKRYNERFTLTVAILIIAAFIGGVTYIVNKMPDKENHTVQKTTRVIVNKNSHPLTEARKINNSSIHETDQIGVKEYTNFTYHFKFDYPSTWTLEEKNLPDFFEEALGKDFYTGLAIILTNPVIPKTAYDCCYTPEEIEKDGIKPSLVLMIIESISYPVSEIKETFGDKARDIFNELISEGYSPKNVETLLSFVPSRGEYVGEGEGDIIWKDGCREINLIRINGNLVVKSSGCWEGVVENTKALFVRKDNLVFSLEDDASEYSKRGDFDKILESFVLKN